MSTIKADNIATLAGVSTSMANAVNGSAKAWVNFNGTGTVAIRGSYNVSSITDNGTGDYTVNLTNAMPDVNFSVCGSSNEWTNTFSGGQRVVNCCTPSSSTVRLGITYQNGGVGDQPIVCVAVFR